MNILEIIDIILQYQYDNCKRSNSSTDTMTSTSKDDFMFFINGMIMEYD